MAEGVREGVVGEERSGRLERRAVEVFEKRRVGGVDRRMVGGLDLSRGRCQKSLSFDGALPSLSLIDYLFRHVSRSSVARTAGTITVTILRSPLRSRVRTEYGHDSHRGAIRRARSGDRNFTPEHRYGHFVIFCYGHCCARLRSRSQSRCRNEGLRRGCAVRSRSRYATVSHTVTVTNLDVVRYGHDYDRGYGHRVKTGAA
jgi:hypothetical protein